MNENIKKTLLKEQFEEKIMETVKKFQLKITHHLLFDVLVSQQEQKREDIFFESVN